MSSSGPVDNAVVDLYKSPQSLKNQRLILSSADPFTPKYVQSMLTQNSDPAATYESRVKNRQILLENPARESRLKRERREKEAKKKAEKQRVKGKLGSKAAREKALWRIEPSQAKFALFLPLHRLWLGYMSELLALTQPPSMPDTPSPSAQPNAGTMQAKLLKADFHGSVMTVKESKNAVLVGLSGIVIRETENAFEVVTKQDKVKLIPKQNSIFTFAVPLYSTLPPSHTNETPLPLDQEDVPQKTALDDPHIEFDLYGNQFRFRAADRAGRKFKPKETIEL
ncbi:hypothetical protein HGRIS_012466 [Hohenbuehelia grisea]|uniref:Ribonuclease P protein subunit n=1 Tax=Hohenbuehelia grisea TaxID=104357 RepID=A0ABR3ISE4_9AGAR